jgi:beta-N-acetylhexosaminidase
MGLRGQIGQHFIIPLRTTEVYAKTVKNTRGVEPAGYILYPKNIGSRQQLQALTKQLRALAKRHTGSLPLVAVDQEGGRVRALRLPSVTGQPSAHDMGRYNDTLYMESAGYTAAIELSSLGINMNFAPVLDLYGDEDRGVIGDRALSPDPDTVTRLALAYAAGLKRGGVIAVGKHFPGHGATSVDSHGELPRVYASRWALEETHLRPFAAASDAGIPALMTAHIVYPRLDKWRPATLSSVWLTEILREDLGFEGVIVSDALEMRALTDNFTVKETLRLGLDAGINLFLITDWIDSIRAVESVVAMVEHGLVSRTRIRDGARRVLELKQKYGLL